MLDLVLAISCSLAIGMIFKWSGVRHLDRITLLTANYGAAVCCALTLAILGQPGHFDNFSSTPGLLLLGVVTGASFIAAFFILALATERAGMALAIGVMRLSVVIPVLTSWFIWEEVPSLAQGIGLIIACAAFFLVAWRDTSKTRIGQGPVQEQKLHEVTPRIVFFTLVLLFCTGGMVDVLLKTFEEVYADDNSLVVFLTMVFGAAFLIGSFIVLRRMIRSELRPKSEVIVWGIVLGVINYLSAAFFLRAIRVLSGPFVFPVNNIALVVGAALLGVLFWGERLSGRNLTGIALAAIALVLLGW